MGTWDCDTFQNDTAADWAFEFSDADDLSFAAKKLEGVANFGDEYLEISDAQEALAAAEVVARLKGHWGTRDTYSDPVDSWINDPTTVPAL